MDFLAEIWERFGTTIAAVLAVIALLKSTSKEVQQLVTGFWSWKGWTITAKVYRNTNRRYREYRAKSIMRWKLEGSGLLIRIREYDSCLREYPGKSTRGQLEEITPAKPSWLNDYYVSTALEALSTEEGVVKAKRYSANSWPPRPEFYYFVTIDANRTDCEEAAKIEADSMCSVYQSFNSCPREPRFERKTSAETVSVRETRFKTTLSLKDMAPPCDFCWEKENRERDLRILVDKITKYDLGDIATPEITGTKGEFQEAVADACIESQCIAEAKLVKSIVKQAIDIRREQVARCTSRLNHEWRQGEREELSTTLKEYIKSQAVM